MAAAMATAAEAPPRPSGRRRTLKDIASLKQLRKYKLLGQGAPLPSPRQPSREPADAEAVLGMGGTPLRVGDPCWLRDIDKARPACSPSRALVAALAHFDRTPAPLPQNKGRMFVRGQLTAVSAERCTVVGGDDSAAQPCRGVPRQHRR